MNQSQYHEKKLNENPIFVKIKEEKEKKEKGFSI